MKLLIKIVILMTFVSSLSFANDYIDTFGLDIGVSNTPYNQIDRSGSTTLVNTPDKTFVSFEFFVMPKGIVKRDDIKPYISCTYSYNADLEHKYLLIGINTYFKLTQIAST